MIAKMSKGRGFRGALNYDLAEGKGYRLDSNMAGQTPRELAAEFGQVRALRPRLTRAVTHVSIAAAPGEHLSDEQWTQIGQRWLAEMGYNDNQYIITRHTDTEHEHIHILASRITHTGDVVSDSWDWRRQESIMRDIERDYGPTCVAASADTDRKALTKGDIERAQRTGEVSMRARLQDLCDAAAQNCPHLTAYIERLEAVGVEVVPTVQMNGAKLSGIQYRLNGVTMKGSDLGKRYAAAGIQKRGISYEQGRDGAAISRCREREAHRAFGIGDGGAQASEHQERRGTGGTDRAARASNGDIDRRDAVGSAQNACGFTQIGGCGDGSSQAAQTGDRANPESDRRLEKRTGEPDSADAGLAALAHGGNGRGIGWSSRGRILGLSGTRDTASLENRREKHGRGIDAGHQGRTEAAVQRQITAMGCARYEVGIRHIKSGTMINMEWSRAMLEKSIPWLKRKNAQGNDIYIRPAGDQHGLVLVDDVTADGVARMRAEGMEPTAVIETSHKNFQVWLKLSSNPIAAEARAKAARLLALHFGGDWNSADGKHYGRLAGFTNQKPEHARGKWQPYVLAHECPGNVPKRAVELLNMVEGAFLRDEQKKRLEALKTASTGIYDYWDVSGEYKRQAKAILTKYGAATDYSRLDWMIAVDLAKRGQPAERIAKAIAECSPNIQSRKAGHIEDYAKRTAEKACALPEVQEAIAARQQQHHRHGWSR